MPRHRCASVRADDSGPFVMAPRRHSMTGQGLRNGKPLRVRRMLRSNHQERQPGTAAGRNLGDDLAQQGAEHRRKPCDTNTLTSNFAVWRRSGTEVDLVHTEEVTGSIPVSPTRNAYPDAPRNAEADADGALSRRFRRGAVRTARLTTR